MRRHRYLALSVVFASLVAACGGAADDAQTQPQNPAQQRQPTVVPQGETPPPSPQNMPGGGRGWDPPHSKGKP